MLIEVGDTGKAWQIYNRSIVLKEYFFSWSTFWSFCYLEIIKMILKKKKKTHQESLYDFFACICNF